MTKEPRIRTALDAIPQYRAGKSAPPGAFKLSSNENPYPPLPAVSAAISDAAAVVNRYPDFGSQQLVAKIAEHHNVDEDMVALGTGSVAVMAQTIQVLAAAGDEVVSPWRSFEAYPILVQLSGAKLVKVPLRSDHIHDLAAMAGAITDRTRLVLVCSPNNPTGTLVRQQELDEFLRQVPSEVVVAIDEAYVEFVVDGAQPDGVSIVRERPNVMVLRTFSKAYGLAGLRIGYAIAQRRLAAALRKAQIPFGISTVAQHAALASLSNRAQLLDRVHQLNLERARVVESLQQMKVDVPEPHGNFVWLPLGEDSTNFSEACAAGGVMVRAFAGDGVRVTIGEIEANDRFLQIVKDFG